MNRRSVKIMRRKAGGTAGKNAEKYSVNLPAVWLHAMGLSKEDRVELSFDGEKIVIDETQCNGCGLCFNVCPFGAMEKGE